jgi:phosphoribosylanthranilate isomerase
MVDVSGGVEVSPGIKDEEKVRAFINNAKTVVNR